MIPVATFKEYVELGGKILEKKQSTFSDDGDKNNTTEKKKGNANDQVDSLAKKYMAENKCDYEEAVLAVLESDEKLADKFTDNSYNAIEMESEED
jgi:hypothetical protein